MLCLQRDRFFDPTLRLHMTFLLKEQIFQDVYKNQKNVVLYNMALLLSIT